MILLFSFFLASTSVTGKIYICSKYLFGFLWAYKLFKNCQMLTTEILVTGLKKRRKVLNFFLTPKI